MRAAASAWWNAQALQPDPLEIIEWTIDYLRTQQQPVLYAEFSGDRKWNGEASTLANDLFEPLRLYAAPVPPSVPDVDALAQFIRQIDGNHDKGAGVLAERIVGWLAAGQKERAE